MVKHITHRIQILEANYWEHFKFAKDISSFLPIDHPKRVALENEMNKILTELNKLKEENAAYA